MILIRKDHLDFRGSDELKLYQWAQALEVDPETIKKVLWTLMIESLTRSDPERLLCSTSERRRKVTT